MITAIGIPVFIANIGIPPEIRKYKGEHWHQASSTPLSLGMKKKWDYLKS
jgi:hypothetical protein